MRATFLLVSLLVLAGFSLAHTPAMASETQVEVMFVDQIQEKLDRINKFEQTREKKFRRHRVEGARTDYSRRNKSRFSKAEFGGERLIADVEDYTVENIVRQAVLYNLSQLQLEEVPSRVFVRIEDIKLSRYSLSDFQAAESQLTGTMLILDQAGNQTGAVKLAWTMRPKAIREPSYQGPELAFLAEAANTRLAPLVIGFLERAFEHIYDGKDAPGPVFLLPQRR